MSKRRRAKDWVKFSDKLSYSKSLDLYYYCGQHYDRRSAEHNGLIGAGAQLKTYISMKEAVNA
jgi:hypothetical protein